MDIVHCAFAVRRSGAQLPQQLRGTGGDQGGRLRDRTRNDAQVAWTADVCLHRHWKRVHCELQTMSALIPLFLDVSLLLGRLPKLEGGNVRPSVRPSVHRKFLRFQ